MIIDSHVHVWPEPGEAYPLHPRPELADARELPRASFTAEALFATGERHGIQAYNLVQKRQFRDAAYLTGVVRACPEKCVATAAIDPRTERLSEELVRFALDGVRACRIYPLLSEGNPLTWMRDAKHAELYQVCRDLNLSVACLAVPDCFPEIDRMCAEHPRTRVTIDHMGLIGRDRKVDDDALRSLCALARHKNLYIKLSGFHAQGSTTPPYCDLRHAAAEIVRQFGADRCMWGSDGPYQMREPHTLQASIDCIDSLPISSREKDSVLGLTAQALYFSS